MSGEVTSAASLPVLTTRGLTKRFPGVLAVDNFDLDLRPGEIVALLGQNGAGKSTVIKVLAGLYPHGSYDGQIALGGHPFQPASVAAAEAAGIALVPQDINVVPELSVAANMYLHAEPTRFGMVDEAARHAEARRVLHEFGIALDPRTTMGALDLATQQLVVIARALSKNVRVLILDEPTAALTDNEAQRLFDRMRALQTRGVACLFVSHRLPEVFAIADRILVMRDGRLRGQHRAADTTRERIFSDMVGHTLVAYAPSGRSEPAAVDHELPRASLEVNGLVVHDIDARRPRRVDGLDLAVGKGEIVGLFGLLGAGCGEVALSVFGAWPGRREAKIRVGGMPVAIERPADARRHGIGLIARDRRDTLIPEHSVAENLALASLAALSPRGFLDLPALRRLAMDYVERLQIRTASIDAPVVTLSGGNQQKVQIARWLASGARILLLVDPTSGVDVGARAEINALWRQLAGDGYALLLASSEAEELVEVCDRVVVMRSGRQVDEQWRATATEERLLRAATGDSR
jgi:D-xylose transport system ATP-binding protein